MKGRVLEVTNLGLVEYEDGLDLQEKLHRGVLDGKFPDQLLLLEHPPVVTSGRNAGEDNLVVSHDELERRGIELHHTGRGGDITFHGPGQIVGYPILNLHPDRRDVHRYVRDLEEVMIRTLRDFDVAAGRIPGLTGVWIGDLKIAAIGVRISRWVTSHGFAFNVSTDLGHFDVIVPCGIEDRGVTSLSRVLNTPVSLDAVRESLAKNLASVFEREPVERDVNSRSVLVWIYRRTQEGLRVLLLKRAETDGGFWQPVTGMRKRGESSEEAAMREVREETGIDGELRDIGFLRDFRIRGHDETPDGAPHPWINRERAFALETNDETVRLSPAEHVEYQWIAPAQAGDFLKWRGNQRALTRLQESLS